MKKIYTFLLMAMTAMTVLTSCEDRDADEARTLDGTWTGYIDTYYQDRWGLAGNSYRTTMYFRQHDRYGGIGYEVDYDLNSRYDDYYYCEFEWEVYNGEIVIHYADSWDNVYIYDYHLSSSRFEGYIDDGTTRDIYFELYYDGSFDWGRYHNYYYAPTRSATPSADSTEVHGDGFHAAGKFAKALKAKAQH